jgi:hypothetical protein
VQATVPFIRASSEHGEPTGIDVSRQLTGAVQDLGVFPIPAYGFLRNLTILVTATGGASGAATAVAEDAPFNVLQNIAITEPNGAQIHFFNSGYDAYLAMKWGGYGRWQDPKGSPVYSAPVVGAGGSGNFSFLLKINVEINGRSGLGSLPNQNAAASFLFRCQLAGSGTVYTTAPSTTLPTVRVRVYQNAWDQPNPTDGTNANQIAPPAVNTTQFWSTQIYQVNAGANTIRLTRVGNYIRNLVFVYRAATRAAGQANWPNPMTLLLDARPLEITELNNLSQQMYERTDYGQAIGGTVPAYDSANALDNGVFVRDFTHEFNGMSGYENNDLWLPTLASTRLELQGSFGAAGTLTVLTNDVAIAGNVFL